MLETGRLQIQSYDRAVGRIRAYAQNRIGRLTLASVPSVAANLVPSLLPRFVDERPGVEIELFDIDSRNVRIIVEAGQADLGIGGRPSSHTSLDFEPLFRDRFKVICNSESRLARMRGPIEWSVLARENLILNGASEKIEAPGYRELSNNAQMTVRNVTSLVALAKTGFGVTLLPELATVNLPEEVIAVDLADTSVERVVGVLRRSGATASPVATAFREFILDEVPALIGALGLKQA